MPKLYLNTEINFISGEAQETFASRLSKANHQLKGLKNPYSGNKKKLFSRIIQFVESKGINFDSALDLFCGSASFALGCKLLGKRTVSNDILRSSYSSAVALVVNNDVVLEKCDISSLINTPTDNHFILNNYVDKIFTKDECVALDNYRANIEKIAAPGSLFFELAMVSMCSYVMDRCFVGGRLNKGQVIASLKHRLAHPRNKGKAMRFRRLPNYDFRQIHSCAVHEAYNMDAVELLIKHKPKVDLCYIDPPYGNKQSDYASSYNFFEEYYLGKKIDRSGIVSDPATKFIKSSSYEENFDELIKNCSYIPYIVVSYNNESWGSIETICDLLKKYRKHVFYQSMKIKYKYRASKSVQEFAIISYD